jgi:acyl-CoA thioesterase-1
MQTRHEPTSRRCRAGALAVLVATAAALFGCSTPASSPADGDRASSPGPATSPSAPTQQAPRTGAPPGTVAPDDGGTVYVAVGASETVGVGADDPETQAWPQVLHDTALPDSRLVNVGVSGSTVGEALVAQLPRALAAEPDVVTVWLAVNDLARLVPVEAYEQQLRKLVEPLRRDGRTKVLVGNVPALEQLPAYLACLPDAPPQDVACALPFVPTKAEIRGFVDAYNAAIARVVRDEGAVLVDLAAQRQLTGLVSGDGFHPSTAGHEVVAASFADALER